MLRPPIIFQIIVLWCSSAWYIRCDTVWYSCKCLKKTCMKIFILRSLFLFKKTHCRMKHKHSEMSYSWLFIISGIIITTTVIREKFCTKLGMSMFVLYEIHCHKTCDLLYITCVYIYADIFMALASTDTIYLILSFIVFFFTLILCLLSVQLALHIWS